ncbi:hypothetical protein QUB05_17495 [Microcoleus sp. F10-C6]|uniref:hypothetical protein n=1 Tax=unclassified Microcoleus TaxID=2642155 RepID=UPI002FCFC1BA
MSCQGNDLVWINGKAVPVRYENEGGKAILPSSVERDIALSFIGSALFSPVTGLVIVIGRGVRDIRLTYEDIVQDIKSEVHMRRVDGKADRLRFVYQRFGEEIDMLVNSSYPEEVKQQGKEGLLDAMKQMYTQS